jgi:hypothetical protein
MEVVLRKMKKSKTVSKSFKSDNKTQMDCFFCGSPVSADFDTRAILCSRCTARLAGTPVEINKYPKREVSMTDMVSKKAKTPKTPKAAKNDNMKMFGGNPGRGWHLRKEYVAPNGRVYSFGKLVTSGVSVESK